MSIEAHFAQMQQQTGLKARIKKRIFTNILSELCKDKAIHDKKIDELKEIISQCRLQLSEQQARLCIAKIELSNQKEALGKQQTELANQAKELSNQKEALGKQQTELANQAKELVSQKEALGKQQTELANQAKELVSQKEELIQRIIALDEIVRAKFSNQYSKLDYYDFENRFRGPVELIKQRQSMYLPYLKDKHSVFDFGCGRGEFLELMKENGISAKGIDIYQGYVNLCRGKGLDVVQGDGIEYLRHTREIFDAIFVGQVVEHLDVDSIISLCQLAYARLADDGVLIIETPNPKCLSIYSNAFYIDPSHVKPVHPATMEYYLRKAGFVKLECYGTECSKCDEIIPDLQINSDGNLKEFNAAMHVLADKIYGSQDYCFFAYKV